ALGGENRGKAIHARSDPFFPFGSLNIHRKGEKRLGNARFGTLCGRLPGWFGFGRARDRDKKLTALVTFPEPEPSEALSAKSPEPAGSSRQGVPPTTPPAPPPRRGPGTARRAGRTLRSDPS